MTRTETITNTEADLKDYTPLPTTKTTSVVLQFGTTSRTEILTFPSILYTDYPSSYTFCGTLPTTTAGVAQCLKYPCAQIPGDFDPFNSDSPVFAYPSHPPIPDTIQNISASYLALDPRGSTWDAVWSYDSDYDSLIKPLMPDMGAWNCSPYGLWDAPASVLNTALYLTATSTSTESGDDAGATPAPKASPPKEAPAPAAGKEPAKVEPQAAEVSQILANPFGVGKPAAVAEKPTPAASPSAVAAQAPSADQSPSDNNAGSKAPVTSLAPEKADSHAGTSSNQAANDNGGTPNSPVANPASPKEGSSAPAPNEAPSDNNAASNSPASNPFSPQEGSSNNAASLSIPGLNNEAATAVPAAAVNAVVNVVTTSTNAQGSVVVATSLVPGVIVTTTNAQGSQTVTTLPVVSPQALAKSTPVIINGHTLTIHSQSQYIIAGQTLSPNTPLILGSGSSTTPVVLQTSGIRPVLVIGSSTTTLNLLSSTPTQTTPSAITIGSQTITANAQGQYIVGSQTLTPGGEIVVGATTAPGGSVAVGGTTVSLAASASQVVVGTSTEGLAPYIVGGLGTGPSNGTGAVVPFLGSAERGRRRRGGLGWMAGLLGGMVVWWL
ncbi:MAG: hypothetical protein ASARMPREDX12_009012 [Alectoria sarmentosa]|nr:MAG: hypothetical protein ASARMPREDX12_009012 [Alectoria sarmentosa]